MDMELGYSAASAHDPRPGAGFDSGDCRRWYAVHCQAHREHMAAVHLANQDFTAFLPCREVTRRHARKIETVRRPFFPGYLFVQFDPTRDRWRSIDGTFGVVRILKRNEQPAPVPRGIVEALRENCNEAGLLGVQVDLTPGQSVRVVRGPFLDFVGELDQLNDAGRVRVLLDIMGGRTPVFLPRNYLVPADSCL